MYYFIDGYNFLFYICNESSSLLKKRSKVIQFLQQAFLKKNLRGSLIFDGKIRNDEESGRGYPTPLEMIYTSFDQSADDYILESIQLIKLKNEIIVVTNDRGLRRNLSYLKVKTIANEPFFRFLCQEDQQKEEKEELKETSFGLKRLQKIFEEKLKEME